MKLPMLWECLRWVTLAIKKDTERRQGPTWGLRMLFSPLGAKIVPAVASSAPR